MLLEGILKLETRSGIFVGVLSTGATLGEADVLGLLPKRLTTARAAAKCRTFILTEEALECIFAAPAASALKQHRQSLVAARRKQAEAGVPLCSLNFGATADDTSVQAAVMQAERIEIQSGSLLPISMDDPYGPSLSMLVRGRAVVEMGVEKPRAVLQLPVGSMILESLVAEFGARVRILSDSEIYRFRRSDLMAAAHMVSGGAQWFYRFKLVDNEAYSTLRSRLTNIRGLGGLASHPIDADIQGWSRQRQARIKQAAERRRERLETEVHSKLPLLPPEPVQSFDGHRFGTTAYRSWPTGPAAPIGERVVLKMPKSQKFFKDLNRAPSEPLLPSASAAQCSAETKAFARRGCYGSSSLASLPPPRAVQRTGQRAMLIKI